MKQIAKTYEARLELVRDRFLRWGRLDHIEVIRFNAHDIAVAPFQGGVDQAAYYVLGPASDAPVEVVNLEPLLKPRRCLKPQLRHIGWPRRVRIGNAIFDRLLIDTASELHGATRWLVRGPTDAALGTNRKNEVVAIVWPTGGPK